MDIVSKEDRSRIMRAVRRQDTSAEIRVRKVAHKLGLRFRLHRKDLPGSPDIVFPKYRICLFVHGCFWHRHSGCGKATIPKSNQEYWIKKFQENIDRDRRVDQQVREMGWIPVTIWECETKDEYLLGKILKKFINVDRDTRTYSNPVS